LSYPESPDLTTPEAKRQALIDCGMEAFVDRLDEIGDWAQVLSPGEQQRIAFARVLLKKPDWVFLDEATSSVDQAIERSLYAALKDRLPGITIVSIAHRKELAEFHSRRAEVSGGETANRLLLSPAAAGIAPS
jgi:putative ATP-binding cassette transporter